MATRMVHEAERELIEFLVGQPSLTEIADFRLSEQASDRFYELVDASRERDLTSDERDELDALMRLDHLARLLKIEAVGRFEQRDAQNNGQ